MAKIEAKLAEKGLILPAPVKLPPGMVLPFPEVNLRGNRAIVSGQGPLLPDGTLAEPRGKLGADVSVEDGYRLAQLTGLAILGGLQRALGDLDRIEGWVKAFGMVNCTPDFDRQPAVINGFSDLILDIFGPDVGRHARSAVGMNGLPMQIAVEIEAEVLIRP